MAKRAMKKAATKKRAPKRELIAPRGDKRYIRRDAKGRINESDDVSRSLSQDRRRKAKKAAKPGQGDQGDRKPRKPAPGKRRVRGDSATLDLFGDDALPEASSISRTSSAQDEETPAEHIESLPFKEFEFHGFTGKRRIVSFGWRYDFNGGGLTKTETCRNFSSGIRARAEGFAGIAPGSLQQVLITEYRRAPRSAGTRTAPFSATSSAFRCSRPALSGCGGKAGALGAAQSDAEPRSIYLLRGPSRTEWEHSIPGVEAFAIRSPFVTFLKESA